MGTLLNHGDRAGLKIRDSNYRQFTKTERLGLVNDILEQIYQKLVFVESNLIYAEGTITTAIGTLEYTPSFSHDGFLHDGVWLAGEDTYLGQVDEAAKNQYDYDITASDVSEILNSDFEDWTGGDADNWTDSANAVSDEETTGPHGGTGSSLKLTASGAASQYTQSDSVTVTAEKKYHLKLYYKNTAGDTAQYLIYDVSNGANIVAATDLSNITGWSAQQSIEFTTPAGCTSIYVRLYAKADGDIVWFDDVYLATTLVGEPEAYYLTENGKVGFLDVPDDAYIVHILYWKPLTALTDYDADALPWGGIFNRYIQRMLVFEMKEVLERDNSRDAVMAQMKLNQAMNMVYARGIRRRRQASDMFSIPNI